MPCYFRSVMAQLKTLNNIFFSYLSTLQFTKLYHYEIISCTHTFFCLFRSFCQTVRLSDSINDEEIKYVKERKTLIKKWLKGQGIDCELVGSPVFSIDHYLWYSCSFSNSSLSPQPTTYGAHSPLLCLQLPVVSPTPLRAYIQ